MILSLKKREIDVILDCIDETLQANPKINFNGKTEYFRGYAHTVGNILAKIVKIEELDEDTKQEAQNLIDEVLS